MRKLLIIAPSFLPNLGGVEKHLAEVLPVISKHDYKITMFVRFHKDIPEYQEYKGISVYRMPKEGLRSIRLKIWLNKNRRLWEDTDVVHSHDYYIPYLKKQLLCRWVHTFHGFESYPVQETARHSRQLVNQAVDYTFAVGKFIEKWYGTQCDEIIWGASSMKAKKAAQKDYKFTFIFLGRLEPDTGILSYLKGFMELVKKDSSSNLLIVGDGSLHHEIQQQISSHNLSDRVIMQGATKNPEKVFLQAKIALVSGYLAIIEAGRLQMPVVAVYENPLKKDYLKMHPAAAELYIAGSVKQLAKVLRESLEDKSGRAKKLQEWSKKQTWPHLATRYIESYKEN